VKIVLTSDFHIHPHRICSRDLGHDRLLDGLSVLRQSLELARRQAATWVFAGDFKQPKTSWPQEALTGAHEVLRDFPDVEKVMVAGNHDAYGLGGSGLAPFKDVATVVEEPTRLPRPDLVCAPWNGSLEVVRSLLARNNLPLVAHGFIAGCMLGPEDARIAKGTPAADYGSFPVAFFGDVHKGQWRRPGDPSTGLPPTWVEYPRTLVRSLGGAPGPRWYVVPVRPPGLWAGEVFYCGSPYQQNWGERNDPPKGALVVDLSTGRVDLHPIESPRFMHFDLEHESALEEFLAGCERYRGDFVRVVYSGKGSMLVGAAKIVGDHFRSYQFITRKVERTERRADVHAGLSTKEILERYSDATTGPDGVDRATLLAAGYRLAGVAE
jgi:hypothetical protein